MSTLKTATITTQGNLASRKSHDPSGYVVMSPGYMPKTFRTLKGAVLWSVKKGYQPKLSQPARKVGAARGLQAALAEAIAEAETAIAAEKARKAEEYAAEAN